MGWRAGAAVTGTATVMLLAVIIQLLWASPLWTFTGGLLLATEGLNLVQSRTGTLDIFVAFWVVLVFVFLLLDRRWIERRTPPPAVEASPAGDGEAGRQAEATAACAVVAAVPVRRGRGRRARRWPPSGRG